MPLITLDLETLTLGEMAAAEKASGEDINTLLGRSAQRILLAVFIDRLRNSGQPPSWQELGALRLRDAQSSTSESPPDSPGPT